MFYVVSVDEFIYKFSYKILVVVGPVFFKLYNAV